jgi:hypothetical protein
MFILNQHIGTKTQIKSDTWTDNSCIVPYAQHQTFRLLFLQKLSNKVKFCHI